MDYKKVVLYADSAVHDLKSLDRVIAKRIVKKIDDNSLKKDPTSNAKKLSGQYSGLYRYRIGEYRAIFEYDTSGNIVVLLILKVGHRKNIYR